MRIPKKTAVISAVAALTAALIAAKPAGATVTDPQYIGWSGGTEVIALGGLVTSSLTSPSAIGTSDTGVTKTNSAASADVTNLLSVGAVSTSESTAAVSGGGQVISHARTAGVSLLNGLIKVAAVDTTLTASLVNGQPSFSGNTTFVGLQIAGATLPLTIPKNFQLTIPGIATVILNGAYASFPSDGSVVANGAAIYVTLLKSQGANDIGTTIYVNPVHSQVSQAVTQTGLPVAGFAYGTHVDAKVTNDVHVNSSPTSYNVIGAPGTNGKDVVNNTVGINLPGILNTGVIRTIANATSEPNYADVTMTTEITGVNLLGGLIRADALKGVAQVSHDAGHVPTISITTQLVNLVIAGAKIPINVSPNTVINVAGLGTVTINAQAKSANAAGLKILEIKLSTAKLGLPVGALIEVGVAAASVG
jgi:hypothetical protein